MRSSTAATVQHGDPLGKLVSLGSSRKYTRFVGTENVPVICKDAKTEYFKIIRCRRMDKKVTIPII
jgi:hypothetical protein